MTWHSTELCHFCNQGLIQVRFLNTFVLLCFKYYLLGSLPLSINPYLSLGQSSIPLTTPTTTHHLSTSPDSSSSFLQSQLHTISSQANQGDSLGEWEKKWNIKIVKDFVFKLKPKHQDGIPVLHKMFKI